MTQETTAQMTREKSRVALTSVIAAVFLTAIKLVVGVMTSSLGIIAEALHSGLDLLAALVTLIAVRTSDRPADKEHQYGHGKVESLSALAEAALLFVTSGWVTYEAIRRIRGLGPPVEVSLLALGVMAVSIVVNIWRARALSQVAHKYSSQALEADALHFSTDIYSSLAVIAGLASVRWLHFRLGDPLVALVVAILVAVAAVRLTARAVNDLMDIAPGSVVEQVRQSITETRDIHSYDQLRIRHSGNRTFIDVTIRVDPRLPLTRAHEVTRNLEQAIAQRLPDADVVIHVEPAVAGSIQVEQPDAGHHESVSGQIEEILNEHLTQFVNFHDVHADARAEATDITFHLVMPEGANVRATHDFCDHIESDLKQRFANARINIHVEPCDHRCGECRITCDFRREPVHPG
jgi:cation diffusion facilitator family transporter